ncbi:MAG: hypothetical protein ACK5O2_17360 [Microthrixaceae bacterium]
MRTRRSTIPAILLALLAALSLVAGACTKDNATADKGDSDTEQNSNTNDDDSSSGEDSSDEDTSGDDATQPEPTGDFSETVSGAMAELEGATDACELYGAVATIGTTVGNPTTKEEVKAASDFYVAMLDKMAETSSDPATADTLREGAKNFGEFAASVDYDPEKMDLNGAGPAIENSEELDTAMNSYAETEFLTCENISLTPQTGEPDAEG